MSEKARRISFSGVGSAVSLLFVVLSYYFEIISLSMNILATSGIMLILSQKFYKDALLSVIVVSILGFLFVNISVLPFVLVGGSYTVFTIFWQQKGYNYYKSLPIKVVYSVLVFFVLYFLTTLIAFNYEEFSFLRGINKKLLYIILNIVFTIAYIIYDLLLLTSYQYFVEKVLSKISRK